PPPTTATGSPPPSASSATTGSQWSPTAPCPGPDPSRPRRTRTVRAAPPPSHPPTSEPRKPMSTGNHTGTAAATGRRRTWLSVLGVVLLPLLLVATLVATVWQAGERNHTVRAAIVNLDEPVTVDDQYVPLGRQFAGTLTSLEEVPGTAGDPDRTNYDWQVTNAEDAADGLRTGRYAAVVTIPENFSSAATSTAGDADEAEQAVVDVEVSPAASTADTAFARSVVQAAIDALNTDLTQTFLDNVFVGFTTMGKQFATIADASEQLADGTHELAGGLGEVSDGAAELDKGMQQLDRSGGELASGVKQYTGGVTSLAEGLRQLQQGTTARERSE